MNMDYKKLVGAKILLACLGLVFITGCSYSFTGASVPPHLQSIHIPVVQDRSGSGVATMAQYLSEGLVQNFIDDNTLQIADDKASSDALLECTIVSFSDRPSTVTDVVDAANSREIKISVKVLYRDLVKRKKIFDKNFQNSTTFISETSSFTEEREKAINDTLDKIAEDILLGVVSNW